MKRGKSQSSSKDSNSLDRMVKGLKAEKTLTKFKVEMHNNEVMEEILNCHDIISSLFEAEN